jgi:hypothetical protein
LFILLTLGLFITCDDPNNPFANPFTNNLGEKVVVEAPTIVIDNPKSGSFLPGDLPVSSPGVVTIEGTAKAYIKVEKVEWRVFANENYNQSDTGWRTDGLRLGGGVKERKWFLEFDTKKFNGGKDGFLDIQFRVWDTKASAESVKYIYVIKNNPSEIQIASPPAEKIIIDPNEPGFYYDPENVPKIIWGGEIRGQVIDLRGLRPGFPQIKIWKDTTGTGIGTDTEPDDDGPDGYVSLFLPGIGSNKEYEDEFGVMVPIGFDKIDEDHGSYYGSYANRSKMRVVNTAPFSFRLAEYDVDIDPNDTNVRRVQYKKDAGGFKNFESGATYYFRIRTSDVEPDLANGSIPKADSPKTILGIFPPLNFGGEYEDPLFLDPPATGPFAVDNPPIRVSRPEPVKIVIFSSNARPSIELDNSDVTDVGGVATHTGGGDVLTNFANVPFSDNNKGLVDWKYKPNIYIAEPVTKKIAVKKTKGTTTGKTDFRLRLKIIQPNGFGSKPVELKWKHESGSGSREGTLSWDQQSGLDYSESTDIATGVKSRIYTFTAKDNFDASGEPIFVSHPNPYELTVTVYAGDNTATEWPYVVYMDGDSPDVSIRSIRGTYSDPAQRPGDFIDGGQFWGGQINEDYYTVNGNIQAVVDRTDDSGIMTYKNGLGGIAPTVGGTDLAMVKWIIEPATKAENKPTGNIITKLKDYKNNPSPNTLKFFNEITEDKTSGWVMKPKPGSDISADRGNHFKINTSFALDDDNYYWLYVIAMDQVQNLGFIVQKIYVNQSTDIPRIETRALFKTNANDSPNGTDADGNPWSGVTIDGPEQLDVDMTLGAASPWPRDLSGNWSASAARAKRNILVKNQSIDLRFRDDDGIKLGDIEIWLTDLNVNLNAVPPEIPKRVKITVNQVSETSPDEVIKTANKRDMSGSLTQTIMARELYKNDPEPRPTHLKDGMYKIEFAVTDDKNEKVKIDPPYSGANPGDEPNSVRLPSSNVTEFEEYYFAMYTEPPDLKVIYPNDNALGSANEMTIFGTVRSRFLIRRAYITFTPDVIAGNPAGKPIELPLYINDTYGTAVVNPDQTQILRGDDGYYTYYWKMDGVKFTTITRFTVEAWDRLGNMSNVVRTVLLDSGGPDVSVNFNYGRPPDPDGTQYVYGKVPFSVSASDENGLYDADGYAGIRWWVIKEGDPLPTWDTVPTTYTNAFPFPTITSSWEGGGRFKLDQTRIGGGGDYEWIIDTRKLQNGQSYQLCVLAMDKAGNLSDDKGKKVFETFTVDWKRDFPVIDPNLLDPPLDGVTSGDNLNSSGISGAISDADLFNSLSVNTYVDIRFPTTVGKPTGPGDTGWGEWIPIQNPASGTANLSIDSSTDALNFTFRPLSYPATHYARQYLGTDGIKYYQIRVRDEPVEGKNNYGKNPDYFMTVEPDKPHYDGYPYDFHDKVEKIYPLNKTDPFLATTEAYSFLVDGSPPVIFFDNYDPTVGHPKYSKDRPTYSKWDKLQEDFKGTVEEYKLISLSLSWSAGNKVINEVIYNDPGDPPTPGVYLWGITEDAARSQLNAAAIARLEAFFREADQGMQFIVIEATDMVGQSSRVSWQFAKDTQGPEISFNITRSIRRIYKNPPFVLGTAVGVTIPVEASNAIHFTELDDDPWPYDFRNGEKWKAASNSKWVSFRGKYGVDYWPSEYAFLEAWDVIKRLTAEEGKTPTTIIGDSVTTPVIDGSFADEYSAVRIDPTNATKTFFYYRFRYATGELIPVPTGAAVTPDSEGWYEKEIKQAALNQNAKSAYWEIPLEEAYGFYGADGENWLDIKVADTAGNLSEIFNVRFLVDRTPPMLGYDNAAEPSGFKIGEFKVFDIANWPGALPAWTPKSLEEVERVFSGKGIASGSPGADGMAFILEGKVRDYNLNGLQITIGQDGSGFTPFTASLTIDTTLTKPWPNDGVTGNTDPQRLSITGWRELPDGTPEWTWQLKILQKDVYALRTATGATDSTRRYIKVMATDRAKKRAGPIDWYFWLDSESPTLDYTNLDKGGGGLCSSFENDTFTLSGIVTDDTRIQDVRYVIAKWMYGVGGDNKWRWWDGSGFTSGAPPTDPTTWPSVYKRDSWPGAYATDPLRQTTMSWAIDKDTLEKGGYVPSPFAEEGYYRIDLYITDWSLGDGNPHNTYDPDDQKFKPDEITPAINIPDPKNSFIDARYNPTTKKGPKSGRVFYVDKKDPTLEWGWVHWDENAKPPAWVDDTSPADPTRTGNKTYFRNETGANLGKVRFGFTVGDGNTIQYWDVKVTDSNQKTTLAGGAAPNWTNNSTTPTATPIPAPGISPISVVDQKLIIEPFMTDTGTSAGIPLDLSGSDPLPTYTITITVKDGAQRTSSIRKQFTLDNRPPNFIEENFSPAIFDLTKPETWNAVTGRFNVRGNTEDNSNKIRRVAFYVPKASTLSAAAPAPQPSAITDATISTDGWHWHDPDYPDSYKITMGGTSIYIEEGTFAWSLVVPQTSMLFSDPDAKPYVQWTTKKGNYYDVTVDPATGASSAVSKPVPDLKFNDRPIEDDTDDVGLLTVYMLAEDEAGNVAYKALKYWIWPEGDRPQVIRINSPDDNAIKADRMLNGSIRISGTAKDNERVKYVWFRVLKTDGSPYTNIKIEKWNEETWEAVPNSQQDPVQGSTIGSLKGGDTLASSGTGSSPDGWYMANIGGNSRDVSWYAYINTNGELNPTTGFENEITIEVRAEDQTWDDEAQDWKQYVTNGYRGLVSLSKKVTAWVVSNAPNFSNAQIAPVSSNEADGPPSLWVPFGTINIRNRSAYKVTVKHNLGLSAIRWSPTVWDKTLNGGSGGFQKDPRAEPYNLLNLDTGEYVYFTDTITTPTTTAGEAVVVNSWTLANSALNNGGAANVTKTSNSARMTATVVPKNKATAITAGNKYLVWNWNQTGGSALIPAVFAPEPSYYESDGVTFKNLRNTILTATAGGSIPSGVVLLEPDVDGNYQWDVIVDVNARALMDRIHGSDEAHKNEGVDPDYGNGSQPRIDQVRDSVFYPLYLTAAEVSKSTPFTTNGDTLLPVDQKQPTGIYTLNRKPAGIAAAIGGEAGDEGPVKGIARVVLWFSRVENNATKYISWHELGSTTQGLSAVSDFQTWTASGANSGPVWWDKLDSNVIDSGVSKPKIPAQTAPTGGDYAIVVDNSGKGSWGHNLSMGFSDGGMGKYWYVEIDSTGITSGPVTLHFVVMDKAGNAKYYHERLVVMNNVAKIDRIKLGTDIRHNTSRPTLLTGNNGRDTGTSGTSLALYPILDAIRGGVPLAGDSNDVPVFRNDVKKGISDWISSSALNVTNIIDFNVRNNLFALRVETTGGPAISKQRKFRLEYVSNITRLTDAQLPNMKVGRIYIIDDPGTAKWGAIGADGEGPWPRGYAFIAVVNGTEANISGTGSVWELNSSYYDDTGTRIAGYGSPNLQLDDVSYPVNTSAINEFAKGAEFVYGNAAFGDTVGTRIVDYGGSDAYPAAGVDPLANAAARQSMFVIKVFDGPESDTFGDFAIIRVRVNNDDKTEPFAQLYDMNPKTEGQDRQNIAPTFAGKSNERTRSVSPMFIGEGTGSNRTKGGLWNIASTVGVVEKPGHIEPRRITYPETQAQPQAQFFAQKHSLSSEQMGGARNSGAATIIKPFVNPNGLFTTDTVSGQVVLRGYAEDDQRIQRVDLVIRNGTTDRTVNILQFQENDNTPNTPGYGTNGNTDSGNANYSPPLTGLLKIGTNSATNPTTDRVYFTDSIDAYRHRVEWAYIWDTETLADTPVVGNVTVRVTSYNRRNLNTDSNTGAAGGAKTPSPTVTAAAPNTHSNVSAEATKPLTKPFNPGFPQGMYEYNSISVNLRPYITGFLRNKNLAAHNTRSSQGRYMFAREEIAVVTGFNLMAGSNAAVINIPGMGNFTTQNVGASGGTAIEHFGITTPNNMRYRQFTVGNNAATGSATSNNGVVTLTVSGNQSPNTGNGTGANSERAITTTPSIRPTFIQPWNIEYSPGIDGSQLWDDFTQVHIWQSNDTAPGAGNNSATNGSGYFFSRPNAKISNPAMSMDLRTGTLYESHNGSGGTNDGGDFYNTGRTIKSPITINTYGNSVQERQQYWVTQFSDPIFFSDVYRSPGNGGSVAADTWAVSSIIGRSGDLQHWRGLGGIYISGPGGAPIRFTGGGTGSTTGSPSNQSSDYSRWLYYGESTWYNASNNNRNFAPLPPSGTRLANPPSTDQFMNPHIVTSIVDNVEHIHVAYYDDLTGSIKYRYNRRGTSPDQPNEFATGTTTGRVDGGTGTDNNAVNNNNDIPKLWVNLDGDFDQEDMDQTTYLPNTGTGTIGSGTRVVNQGRAKIKAGKHNSIAVTSQGYPVIAYYDQTNQKLKLAASRSASPILASAWTIIDDISTEGTGEFVSMKINTVAGANPGQELNRVHIAAMNTNKRLVYITFTLSVPNTGAVTIGTITEQVVDSVGNVGRWCSLSLDGDGNPWISYMDESYLGARDGVKLAYKNTTMFYKGVTDGTYFPDKYLDINGKPIGGWETMHIPTKYRVQNPVESGREHGRLGMECYPSYSYLVPRNTNLPAKFWSGAVSYISTDLGMDRYHIAYYVK